MFPYVTRSIPRLDQVVPKPQPVQAINYEAECRKLGIDYSDFIAEVNDRFYRKYPERRGRPLSQSQADERLRSEWHRIAQNLLNQKSAERRLQRKVAEF